MVDPLFWLGLSCLLLAVSLMAVLIAAVPALRELGRASRSAEKLFDTLNRELPPTLEALRLTGAEITELTEEVSESVYQASKVIQQVEQGVSSARQQAQQVQVGTQSLMAGFKAAWRAWHSPRQGQAKGGKKYSPQGKNLRSRPSTLAADPAPRPRSARPQAKSEKGVASRPPKAFPATQLGQLDPRQTRQPLPSEADPPAARSARASALAEDTHPAQPKDPWEDRDMD